LGALFVILDLLRCVESLLDQDLVVASLDEHHRSAEALLWALIELVDEWAEVFEGLLLDANQLL
jgi:hypothetical protein